MVCLQQGRKASLRASSLKRKKVAGSHLYITKIVFAFVYCALFCQIPI
jgi:hypothetical protein